MVLKALANDWTLVPVMESAIATRDGPVASSDDKSAATDKAGNIAQNFQPWWLVVAFLRVDSAVGLSADSVTGSLEDDGSLIVGKGAEARKGDVCWSS